MGPCSQMFSRVGFGLYVPGEDQRLDAITETPVKPKMMIFLLVPSGEVMCFDWRISDNSSHFLSVPALRTSAAMTTRPVSM